MISSMAETRRLTGSRTGIADTHVPAAWQLAFDGYVIDAFAASASQLQYSIIDSLAALKLLTASTRAPEGHAIVYRM